MLDSKPGPGFGRPATVGLVKTSISNLVFVGPREHRGEAVIDAESDPREAGRGVNREDPTAASR